MLIGECEREAEFSDCRFARSVRREDGGQKTISSSALLTLTNNRRNLKLIAVVVCVETLEYFELHNIYAIAFGERGEDLVNRKDSKLIHR